MAAGVLAEAEDHEGIRFSGQAGRPFVGGLKKWNTGRIRRAGRSWASKTNREFGKLFGHAAFLPGRALRSRPPHTPHFSSRSAAASWQRMST